MKKVLSICIAALLTLCSFSQMTFGAVSAADFQAVTRVAPQAVASADLFDYRGELTKFVTDYPVRTSGEDSEYAAALYLAGKLNAAGLEDYRSFFLGEDTAQPSDFLQSFSFDVNRKNMKSQNVIGVKRSSVDTQQLVVIGAHYDNVAKLVTPDGETTTSQGAYDNGSGVTVLLSIIQKLSIDLPFHVVFCFFGSEETYLNGSSRFVDFITDNQKWNTLLYVNLDSIAAGDHLYMYTDEVETQHDAYFRQAATDLQIDIHKNPFNKKIQMVGVLYFPYLHVGLSSDHLPFLAKHINCVNFFTLNWDSNKTYTTESNEHENIMHTPNDNADTLFRLYPESAIQHMSSVSRLVVDRLVQPDFSTVMLQSFAAKPNYDFWIHPLYAMLVGLAILAVSSLVVTLVYIRIAPKKNQTQATHVAVFGDEFEPRKK